MTTKLPAVIEKYLEAYNALDVDLLLQTVTDDVVFEHISNHGERTRTVGRHALEELARASAAAFSFRRQSVLESVVEPDRVALLVNFEATVRSDLPNGWRAGAKIQLAGSSFFFLQGGRIARLIDLS